MSRYCVLLILFFSRLSSCFIAQPCCQTALDRPSSVLFSKVKSSGRGFGKSSTPRRSDTEEKSNSQPEKIYLQSIDVAATDSPPTLSDPGKVDMDLAPPEQRAKSILREKYGMKTREEQQLDERQLELYKERQRKVTEWKRKLEGNDDVDLLAIIPAPVLRAIDTFLKLGLGITAVAFILSGIAITLEAWSKATGSELPENIDQFIVGVVEPNFTKGLFVLLGFSVSLGLFASAQMGSKGAQYKEGE